MVTEPLNSPLAPSLDTTAAHQAGVQEVFSSIQGEGVLVGVRQIFVRFNGCHLRCAYCDTPAQAAALPCRVEAIPGSGQFESLANPVSGQQLLAVVDQLHQTAKHHSISLTGGEPLLYDRFLAAWLPEVRSLLPVYLETSGTQPERLIHVLPWVDWVAMDIKLPSSSQEPWMVAQQAAFYELSRNKQLLIKLVVHQSTTDEELATVRQIVTDPMTPIIVQPVTSLTQSPQIEINPTRLMSIVDTLARHYEDVRMIPQTHKMVALL